MGNTINNFGLDRDTMQINNFGLDRDTMQGFNDLIRKEKLRGFNDLIRKEKLRGFNHLTVEDKLWDFNHLTVEDTLLVSPIRRSMELNKKFFDLMAKEGYRDHNNAVEGEILQYLSRELGRDWKDLGRYLNIDDSTLDSFEKEHRTQEASYQMLRYWVQLNGSNATYENLAVGLRKVPRANLAEYVEKTGGNKY